MHTLMTKHFGEIQVDDRDVLVFPDGLPGFEEHTQFTLLGKEEAPTPFFWLQSMENMDLALVVVDPFSIYEDYTVDVADEEIEVLQISDPDHVMTLCVVVIPEDVKQMRANLKAPLLINLLNNVGKQVMQQNDSLPIRYFLLQ